MIRKISDRAKPGSISLGLGEPDLPTPDVIVREAVRVIQEEKSGYTLQAGLPSLRERIASDYPHMKLATDQVIVTAGSQEAISVLTRKISKTRLRQKPEWLFRLVRPIQPVVCYPGLNWRTWRRQ
jgi:aspartate/methionine/tyrosine aminotransferase